MAKNFCFMCELETDIFVSLLNILILSNPSSANLQECFLPFIHSLNLASFLLKPCATITTTCFICVVLTLNK